MSKKETISEYIKSIGFQCLNIEEYKNLDTLLMLRCSKGHSVVASFREIRKAKFGCPICLGEQVNQIQEALPQKAEDTVRIVAFDQATQNIGFSVYDNGRLVYYGRRHFSGNLGFRLGKIYNFIAFEVAATWNPTMFIFEDIQLQNEYKTFKTLAMCLGVCTAAASSYGLSVDVILNSVWQKQFNITGSARQTQKNNVVSKVKSIFGIDVTDDEADAILLGLHACGKYEHLWLKSDF